MSGGRKKISAEVVIDRELIITDEEYKAKLRRRCQTDFLFLGRALGYTRLLDRVHGPVAELHVKKNPDKPIEEQSAIKNTLHLDPRGTFKSTASIIDSVQWVICFPDVAVCKLTATKPLSKAIAGEITNHFVCAKGAEPSDFQLLFPEYVIPPSAVVAGEYTAPCRKHYRREATVMSFSIETSISGWHFDVVDPDDVVDNQNSSTAPGLQKVKTNWGINRKTLMPWGYVNFKGTRYSSMDLWGQQIELATLSTMKCLIRGALALKSGKRLEPGKFPGPEEMDLLFPELLPYSFLKEEFERDYGSFMTQYMNDAYGSRQVVFPKELLLKASISASDVPVEGETVMAARLPYDGKDSMKFAAAAVGVKHNNRVTIVDAMRGEWTPSSLAHALVQMAKRHAVQRMTIERTPGAEHMEAAILNYGLALGWAVTINWLDFEEDDGSRTLRLKAAEPLFASTRLLLSKGVGDSLREVLRQFEHFGAIEENELVDVVARVSATLPASIALPEITTEQQEAYRLAKERDNYERTYGVGRYAPTAQQAAMPAAATANMNAFGLPDELGGLNG